jgi:hypothetical protein
VSGRRSRAGRRADRDRWAAPPTKFYPDALARQAEETGHRDVDLRDVDLDRDRDPIAIKQRLGPGWTMRPFGAGGRQFGRMDATTGTVQLVIVSAGIWPELPEIPIVHASMSVHRPDRVPTYDEMCLLHRAVWPQGYAMQAHVPPQDHISIRPNVLHLWRRADGRPLWPIDFGRFGTI